MHQLLNRLLAELPTILVLDSFYWHSQYHKHSYRVEGGSHEVAGTSYVHTKNSQMMSTGAIFTSTYHTQQLNAWPSSSAGRLVNYSQQMTCSGEMEPFKDRQASETSHRKSILGNFQHQYLLNCY